MAKPHQMFGILQHQLEVGEIVKQNHLCPFPFPLVEKIISLCTDEGDWILDPFAGSGSVLAMANEMQRNSVGLDINTAYKKRFEDEVLIGVKRYWEKRVKELEEAKLLFANFKEKLTTSYEN